MSKCCLSSRKNTPSSLVAVSQVSWPHVSYLNILNTLQSSNGITIHKSLFSVLGFRKVGRSIPHSCGASVSLSNYFLVSRQNCWLMGPLNETTEMKVSTTIEASALASRQFCMVGTVRVFFSNGRSAKN